MVRVRGGKNGINRNYLDPKLPEWSWHVEEVTGFGDISIPELFASPSGLETIDWSNTSGTSDWFFGGYTVVRELGPVPLYLSVIPEGENIQFYWSGLGTNHVYTLEENASLGSTNWFALPGAAWPLKTNHWTLPQTNPSARFYRVRGSDHTSYYLTPTLPAPTVPLSPLGFPAIPDPGG